MRIRYEAVSGRVRSGIYWAKRADANGGGQRRLCPKKGYGLGQRFVWGAGRKPRNGADVIRSTAYGADKFCAACLYPAIQAWLGHDRLDLWLGGFGSRYHEIGHALDETGCLRQIPVY